MTQTVAPYDMERATPQPSTAVASAPVPQISDAGVRADLSAAQQDKELADATDQYGLHLDTLQAQDALNKLRSKREDLTFGQQGFMQVKGGDVLNPNRPGGPLADDYKARFQAVTDDVAKDLSPRARLMFNEKANAEANAFKGDIGRHSYQQAELYNVAVDRDLQTQTLASAVRYASDPGQIETLAQRAKGSAERLALSKGLPAEGAGISAASNVYRVGIETLLGAGQNRQALSYYDSIKGKLDGPDQVALAGKLKTVQSDLRGEQAANEELARLGLPTIPSEDTSPGGPRENNIGNVRPTGASTGFQAFPTFDAGVAGAVSNLRKYPGAFNGGKPMPLWDPSINGEVARSGFLKMKAGEPLTDAERTEVAKAQRTIAGRWAPYGDGKNDPAAWASNIARTSGIDPSTPIDTNDPNVMAKVARGIHAAEWGGGSLRPAADYTSGTNMAFGGPRVPTQDQSGGGVFKGDLKAGMEKAAYSVLQRPDLNAQEKAKALALLTRQRTQLTAFQEASTKSLDDEAGSTMAQIVANPSLLKPGTFADFADRYRALGDSEKATRFQMLASMEGTFKDGLQSATDAQLQMLKQLAPEGLPKQIVEGYIAGSTKERTEAAVQGAEGAAQLKKSIETDGVQATGLIQQAKDTISHFVHAGKPEEARKVSDYMTAALNAQRLTTGSSPAVVDQALADLKSHADSGQANAQQLQVLSMARGMFDRQQQMIRQDPFKAGTSIYPDVGPPAPLDLSSPQAAWDSLRNRSAQARLIAAKTGQDVIPLNNEEAEGFRGTLDKGNPEQNGALLDTLAKALPADMVPGVAKALVGKAGGTGISQSYGASMLLKSSGDAADAAVANEVLRGAAMRKARGEDAKAATPSQQAWRGKIQEEIGTSLSRTDARQRAMIEQAIESVYVYRMAQSGKSADGYDDGVLRDATRAVLGTPVTVNGGQVYPPERGQTSYDVSRALGTITDADVRGLKTLDGTDIPARLIQSGQLQNVGTGRYVVTVRDPRTGTRAEIPDPNNPRQAWVLDLSEFNERGKAQKAAGVPPPVATPLDAALRARRLAPASPTEGASP